jgi:hypothetical protein
MRNGKFRILLIPDESYFIAQDANNLPMIEILSSCKESTHLFSV